MSKKESHGGRLFLKFLVSFVLVAIIPFLVIEYLYLTGIRSFNEPVLSQSRHLIGKMAKMTLRQKVWDVARELEIYLQNHNVKDETKLKNDPLFKALAVQPVGKWGNTEVYTTDGIPLFNEKQTTVAPGTARFQGRSQEYWKILKKGSSGPAGGFYSWKGLDGQTDRIYMFSVPVRGTNLVVSAQLSMGRVKAPLKRIETVTRARQKAVFLYLLAIAAAFLIYLILISYFLARRITRPIIHLAYIVDRIGLGDLNVKIAAKTRDETMTLIEAIERMQKSLKSAISHLRSRENRMV